MSDLKEENQDIQEVLIEESMRGSYLDYSMSVIVGRALPDARDGLKPVHRRILYSMKDLNLTSKTPYKKSARICRGRDRVLYQANMGDYKLILIDCLLGPGIGLQALFFQLEISLHLVGTKGTLGS